MLGHGAANRPQRRLDGPVHTFGAVQKKLLGFFRDHGKPPDHFRPEIVTVVAGRYKPVILEPGAEPPSPGMLQSLTLDCSGPVGPDPCGRHVSPVIGQLQIEHTPHQNMHRIELFGGFNAGAEPGRQEAGG